MFGEQYLKLLFGGPKADLEILLHPFGLHLLILDEVLLPLDLLDIARRQFTLRSMLLHQRNQFLIDRIEALELRLLNLIQLMCKLAHRIQCHILTLVVVHGLEEFLPFGLASPRIGKQHHEGDREQPQEQPDVAAVGGVAVGQLEEVRADE